MYVRLLDRWLDIRDRINNKLIRFLSRHCCYDSRTCRLMVSQIPYKELEYLNNERVSKR